MNLNNPPERSPSTQSNLKSILAKKQTTSGSDPYSNINKNAEITLDSARISEHNSRPILSLKDLAENRLEDISNLYQALGYSFTSDIDLLSQIRSDWKIYREIKDAESTENGIAEELTPIVISCGDQSLSIFGACHSWSSGQEYHTLFNRTIAEYPSIVAEQGMGDVFSLTNK